eukprot:IDg602t1
MVPEVKCAACWCSGLVWRAYCVALCGWKDCVNWWMREEIGELRALTRHALRHIAVAAFPFRGDDSRSLLLQCVVRVGDSVSDMRYYWGWC